MYKNIGEIMWNKDKFNKILDMMVADKKCVHGKRQSIYQEIANNLDMSIDGVKSWMRTGKKGPNDAQLLIVEKTLNLEAGTLKLVDKEKTFMNREIGSFEKQVLFEVYNLVANYIEEMSLYNEEKYCEMFREMEKRLVFVPGEISEKISKVVEQELGGIVYGTNGEFEDCLKTEEVFVTDDGREIPRKLTNIYEYMYELEKRIDDMFKEIANTCF